MVNILVVRQKNNQLGDMICALPMFYALKKKFPDSHITLVCSATTYNVGYKELNPYLDEILVINKKTLKQQIDFLKTLRKRKYDYGIVPSTLEVSTTSHVVNFLSGAKKRVGLSKQDETNNPFSFLLNIKKEFNWKERNISQAFRALEIVNQIGCELSEEEIQNISIKLNTEHYEFADTFMKNNLGASDVLIGVHPGAGKPLNMWPVNSFAELIESLNKQYNAEFFISAGALDTETVDKLAKILTEKNINFVVEKSPGLEYSSALMKKLDLFVSNDTGALHLASISKVKSIGLFGPTSSNEWKPIGKDTICIQSPTEDINDIKPEAVLEEANKILSRKF